MRRLELQSIIVPLTVMLMLTVLAGYSAFQMTNTWEKAISNISTGMVRAQSLNNIQWQLRQIHQIREQGGDTETAHQLWHDVKKQVHFMSRRDTTQPPIIPYTLQLFMSREQNMDRIPVILKEDYFQYNLAQLQHSLVILQQHSKRVTLVVTVSMAILGVLLMSVTAMDLTRLFRELAASRDLNNTIQEEERHRIAQELHDAVVQELIDLKRSYAPEKVDGLIDSIRRICHSLKPQILEDLGLKAALELLVDDLQKDLHGTVTLNVQDVDFQQLPKSYELPLFRIVQELFNNIKRHAGATQTTLTLIYDAKESPMLRLYIRDNGRGFDPTCRSKGLGLTGVRERVLQLGGKLTITSKPGNGSSFQVFIPIQSL